MGNRTALFNRVQPGGVYTIDDFAEHPGEIRHVNSTTTGATDGPGYGQNPDAPYATLDYAVGQLTNYANEKSVIYAGPGHVETIDAAGALALDTAGITIIGLGNGEDRPSLNWTAVDATVSVDEPSIEIENFRFTQGIDVIVTMFDVNDTDFTHRNCEWIEAAAAQAVSFVDLDGGGANACDRYRMIHCRAIQRAAGADQIIDIAQIQDGVEIIDCVLDADCENAPIYSPAILTDILIQDNVIKNRQAGDHAIELSAAAIGFIIDNRLFTSALATTLDPGSCYCAGNLAAEVIDTAGVPIPLAAAAGLPADSITAAAIATDAIDADAIAANAIGAAEIAAAALTVAKFATDIGLWQLDTATSASALTSGTIFTWTGSIEFYIVGRITTDIQPQATTVQLTVTPDALGAYALCATVDANNMVPGTLLSITGTAANGMVATDAVGSIAPGQANPVYVTCVTNGVISTAFGAASTGAIVWELLWRPLSAGATVTPV